MSNTRERKAEDALQEYLWAVDEYNKLIDKYFPVREVAPGVEITPGEPITKAVCKELDEAETKVTKTRKKWGSLMGL